jgi:hypothetical protein
VTPVSRALRKLGRHDIREWALTGGIAFEFHGVSCGLAPAPRPLNDLDFVTDSFDYIPATLSADFLFRHVHPYDPPGKILLQLIDPETPLRVDVFRACGQTMRRTLSGPPRVVSLPDLVARTARQLLDLAEGKPVASKHARDYLRFVDFTNPVEIETAWGDHRKPSHPATFQEARRLLPDLIRTHPDLLIDPEYSKTPGPLCSRCVATGAFQLADANVILSLLGYC